MSCPYNSYLSCSEIESGNPEKCKSCGWNPEVAKKRLQPEYHAIKRREREKGFWEMYNKGRSDKRIAAAFGVSPALVFKWRQKNELAPNTHDKTPWIKAKELYDQGYSDREIAEAIGRDLQLVRNWRSKNKLPVNTGLQKKEENNAEE